MIKIFNRQILEIKYALNAHKKPFYTVDAASDAPISRPRRLIYLIIYNHPAFKAPNAPAVAFNTATSRQKLRGRSVQRLSRLQTASLRPKKSKDDTSGQPALALLHKNSQNLNLPFKIRHLQKRLRYTQRPTVRRSECRPANTTSLPAPTSPKVLPYRQNHFNGTYKLRTGNVCRTPPFQQIRLASRPNRQTRTKRGS